MPGSSSRLREGWVEDGLDCCATIGVMLFVLLFAERIRALSRYFELSVLPSTLVYIASEYQGFIVAAVIAYMLAYVVFRRAICKQAKTMLMARFSHYVVLSVALGWVIILLLISIPIGPIDMGAG